MTLYVFRRKTIELSPGRDAAARDIVSPAQAPEEIAPTRATLKVPREFVSLAGSVVWHRDPERFARLYALLWRLRSEKGLMEDRGDTALTKLRSMEKAVHRDRHKMTAFVRFRDRLPEIGVANFAVLHGYGTAPAGLVQ